MKVSGGWPQPDTAAFPATIGAVLVLGAEAAFLGEIVDGGQFPFTRLRIRLDVPVVGHYRVTEPYGVHLYEVPALVAGNEVNESFDVEFTQGTVDAAGTVTEAINTYAGPWLTWDTFPVGDPDTDRCRRYSGFYWRWRHPAPDHRQPHRPPTNLFRIEAFTDAAMTVPMKPRSG